MGTSQERTPRQSERSVGILGNEKLPFVYGNGDRGHGPGILQLGEVIRQEIPGIKVKCISTGKTDFDDIEDSYLKPCNQQIDQVCTELLADPDFRDGVHMIGLSQGGLFVRALAQRCAFKQLGAVISIGGPQMGVFGVPKCRNVGPIHLCALMEKLLSYGAYTDFVQKHLVQAEYWHDPFQEQVFQDKCHFLSDINQEKHVNETYRTNLLKVKALVLTQFTQDTVLKPYQSEWFGFFNNMSDAQTHSVKDTDLYVQDRLGLKELDETNRLHFLKVDGDHLRFSLKWFIDEIVKVHLV